MEEVTYEQMAQAQEILVEWLNANGLSLEDVEGDWENRPYYTPDYISNAWDTISKYWDNIGEDILI